MDLNKLTEKAQQAVLSAQQLAQDRSHSQIEVEHLMYSLLDQAEGVVPSVLGKLGVEVRRMTFISEWTKFSLFLNPLGVNEKDRVHNAALPYLKRDIGGDGWESVGEKVLHANEYDGLIHLAPFTCMPEIVAQNIMPSTKEKLPVLTILCDEQMAKPGVLTRLEAFVDLLERKRSARLVSR